MKLDWNQTNDGTATHSANDETVTYFTVAPNNLTIDDVATAFLNGYDTNDMEGPVTFCLEEMETGKRTKFSGHPNQEAERA